MSSRPYLGANATLTASRDALDGYPICGNAWQDGPLLAALDRLVMDDTAPIDDRLWAINQIDRVMGIDEPPATEADLAAYVEANRE